MRRNVSPIDGRFDPAGIFEGRLERAAKTSWEYLGKSVTFYLPGMIKKGGDRGRYPCISLSGSHCELLCDHCKAQLLKPMIQAGDPEILYKKSISLWKRGALGILYTGGADLNGRINWAPFLSTIERIRDETGMFISVHSGLLDESTAKQLKKAGVSQALVDVVGDEDTFERVFHLSNGMNRLIKTLGAIRDADIDLAPHIVAGVDYGSIKGEYTALEIVSKFDPQCLVIVVLFPFSETPMASILPPRSYEIIDLFITGRSIMPSVPQSLGCEHPRNHDGVLLEKLAVACGVNRIAVHTEHAEAKARDMGLTVRYQKTCCSLPFLERFIKDEVNFS